MYVSRVLRVCLTARRRAGTVIDPAGQTAAVKLWVAHQIGGDSGNLDRLKELAGPVDQIRCRSMVRDRRHLAHRAVWLAGTLVLYGSLPSKWLSNTTSLIWSACGPIQNCALAGPLMSSANCGSGTGSSTRNAADADAVLAGVHKQRMAGYIQIAAVGNVHIARYAQRTQQ